MREIKTKIFKKPVELDPKKSAEVIEFERIDLVKKFCKVPELLKREGADTRDSSKINPILKNCSLNGPRDKVLAKWLFYENDLDGKLLNEKDMNLRRLALTRLEEKQYSNINLATSSLHVIRNIIYKIEDKIIAERRQEEGGAISLKRSNNL